MIATAGMLVVAATSTPGPAPEAAPFHTPAPVPASPEATQGGPTLRQVMDLRQPGAPMLSPDGRTVLFTVSENDWASDRSTATLWVARRGAVGEPFGSPARVDAPGFGGRALYCGSEMAYPARDNRNVLRILRSDGTVRDVGPLPDGSGAVACSPAGDRVAIAVRAPEPPGHAHQRQLFGDLDIKDEGFRNTHLWLVDVDAPSPSPRRLTNGDFTVGAFAWSPDGSTIAFDHAPDPRPNSAYAADISVVSVDTGELRRVAANVGRDRGPIWSPDGSAILYSSLLDVAVSNLPAELLVVPAAGGEARILTGDFDTEPQPFAWNDAGVWFLADRATARHVYRLDPESLEIRPVEGLPEIVTGGSMPASATALAVRAESRTALPEILVADIEAGGGGAIEVAPRVLTGFTEQVVDWPLGSREVIQWHASDGLRIEGVLWKPDGFDPTRRYPLMVVVHGGPRAVSRPRLVAGGLYPVEQWLARGALVMMPNYRGSVGYGPEFRTAHHRTVGPGDANDVLAGVEHLLAEGFVDEDRIGLMGWSYGGFVSAYLTATSDMFRAISVGAGISDWPTHYAGEAANITTLTFSFGVPPYEDPEAWDAASPMTHIAGAQTPTLIQHVDGDPVVTVLNAYELHWALKNLGVETRFIEYRGPGHGPTGLKQHLGVVWHNQEWFARHTWGEALDLPPALR